MIRTPLAWTALSLLFLAACQPTDPPPSAAQQRLLERGYAELENERPADAEATFAELATELPSEPVAHANLAIARLRQQDLAGARTAVDEALRLAPDDARILAISAEVAHWAGFEEQALAEFERAAEAAPEDLEILFRLYEQARQLPAGAPSASRALARLTELRPENLVLLLARGREAIEAGDRAAASGAFLRVGELLWQTRELARDLLGRTLDALEAGDLEAARSPALGLENVLKITPMYQQGLTELSTAIQGIPIARLSVSAEPADFGPPGEVRYDVGAPVDPRPVSPGGLGVADFDRDGRSEVAWRTVAGDLLLLQDDSPEASEAADPASGPGSIAVVDLDNDGYPDLLRLGVGGSDVLLGTSDGFRPAVDSYLLPALPIRSAVAFDFDIEGDLDIALVVEGEAGIELLRNALDGSLEAVGARAFRDNRVPPPNRVLATDFDRDGDLDLMTLGTGGAHVLRNLRQGEFVAASVGAGSGAGEIVDGASVDLDNDGWPDLALLRSDGLSWQRNDTGEFGDPVAIDSGLVGALHAVEPLDANGDGRLDLAIGGDGGVAIVIQDGTGGFAAFTVQDAAPAHTLRAFDADGDGDEDLAAAGEQGLQVLTGSGAEGRGWLRIQLHGLQQGNSKNNSLGIGSTVEVRNGAAYQFREVTSDTTHFGLGEAAAANVVRVVWTNGVPQNRIELAANQAVVEEQLLKGSCPFVYVWNGESIEFGTDLLWGAPIGLPVAPGVWATADPTEIVHLSHAAPRDGRYDVRITEELWEAAFLDLSRLWIVDHPADVEVASNLAILPGRASDPAVHATRAIRPMAAAWDASGREVTERVRDRDEIYADGWLRGRYQGLAAEPWAFTLDLGAAPEAPIRLLLDGWIFPADASLNLAVAQRSDHSPPGPRLEVETAAGWQPLVDPMPFPAGKTKTMVVDTPALPEGARRLRIVSRLWLSWDRLRWSMIPADAAAEVVARLEPSRADLAYRGFSRLVRRAPNAPHEFDYARSTTASPWLGFPGSYTRYGEVRELLRAADDRLVILAPGDELRLDFDARDLPPPGPGRQRSVFLETHGWDKDADRNTREADTMEPLPFRSMTAYGVDPYPESRELLAYRKEWLTRRVD